MTLTQQLMLQTGNWEQFKAAVTGGGLGWTFTKRSKQVDFMDLTIKIVDGKIETTLYEKPLALHLYIPPHSCHSPGVLTGLVFGNILRICQLCSRKEDIEEKLCQFYARLLDRGYQPKRLTPLFDQALTNSKKYLSQSPAYRQQLKEKKAEASERQVIFHIPYHPDNPPAKILQQLWRQCIINPVGDLPLNQLQNNSGYDIEIERMIIAYSRAPNLGNLLSYRKICNRSGPKVSLYLWLDTSRPRFYFVQGWVRLDMPALNFSATFNLKTATNYFG